MPRSRYRGRDTPCRLSGMGPTVENIEQDFSVFSSMSAGFGVQCMVAARLNSGQRLLDMKKKGVYPSYTLPIHGRECRSEWQLICWRELRGLRIYNRFPCDIRARQPASIATSRSVCGFKTVCTSRRRRHCLSKAFNLYTDHWAGSGLM